MTNQSINTDLLKTHCMFSLIDAQWERKTMYLLFSLFMDATFHFKM